MMNDRILTIAGQNCVGEYHAGILCWRFSENQLRKFTELIVQECVAAAEEAQADPYVINSIYRRVNTKKIVQT